MDNETGRALDLVERLRRQRGIELDHKHVESGFVELDPEHEGHLIAEYGFDALVRYYCPTDPKVAE